MRRSRVTSAILGTVCALALTPSIAQAVTYDLNEMGGLPGGSAPFDIARDGNGDVWFTMPSGDALGVAREGKTAALSGIIRFIPLPAGSHPRSLVLGFDNAIWFTEQGANSIGRIDPDDASATVQHFGTANGLSAGAAPQDIVKGLDSDLNLGLWFTEPGVNKIGRIKLDGSIKEFDSGIGAPGEIARGDDGLYFSKPTMDRVGRIDATGFVTEISTNIPVGAQPGDLVEGPASSVWFTEPGVGMLGRVTTGGNNTVSHYALPFGSPTGLINTGYFNGGLLITAGASDTVAIRLSDGGIHDLPVSVTAGSSPARAVSGTHADSLWFTE